MANNRGSEKECVSSGTNKPASLPPTTNQTEARSGAGPSDRWTAAWSSLSFSLRQSGEIAIRRLSNDRLIFLCLFSSLRALFDAPYFVSFSISIYSFNPSDLSTRFSHPVFQIYAISSAAISIRIRFRVRSVIKLQHPSSP